LDRVEDHTQAKESTEQDTDDQEREADKKLAILSNGGFEGVGNGTRPDLVQ
jgi:hypothetical protein